MLEISNEGPAKTFSYYRLKILESKYDLHVKLNKDLEAEAMKQDPKDWTNVMKVTTSKLMILEVNILFCRLILMCD